MWNHAAMWDRRPRSPRHRRLPPAAPAPPPARFPHLPDRRPRRALPQAAAPNTGLRQGQQLERQPRGGRRQPAPPARRFHIPTCTPADRLRPLGGLDGVSARRTTRTLFGVERTVPVTREVLRRAVPDPAARQAATAAAGTPRPVVALSHRAQHHVESAFRKNTHHISLRPPPARPAVHIFCCVLALLRCSLLERAAAA